MQGRHGVLSCPLESHTFDILGRHLVRKDGIPKRSICSLHRTQIDIHTTLLHLWSQELQEVVQSLWGPCASWIPLCRVRLILWHHHIDIYPLLLVGIDELAKVAGVSLQILIVLCEAIFALTYLLVYRQSVL